MGVRGELFSAKVPLKNRSYFFNVKENRLGDLFMTVVESKPSEGEGFDRHQIVLFADDVQEFLKGFDTSLRFIEKELSSRRKAKHESRMGHAVGAPRQEREAGAERRPPREDSSGGKKKVLRLGAETRIRDANRDSKPGARSGTKPAHSGSKPPRGDSPSRSGSSSRSSSPAGAKKSPEAAKRPRVKAVRKDASHKEKD